MRFDSARAAGLTEEKATHVDDGYETTLSPREIAALHLTDALIGLPGPLPPTVRAELEQQFSAAEIAELAMGVGLFLGMSKVLINLGLEPVGMATTVLPTPGS